jgi:hypothetical protein
MIRKTLISIALAGMVAAPLAVSPTSASASCSSRKTTGTLLGAAGGALIGNSISHGGGGAIVGGLGGAVVGHQIGKSGCHYSRRAYYRSTRSHGYASSSSYYRPAPSRVYYDERGNPVTVSNGSYYYH